MYLKSAIVVVALANGVLAGRPLQVPPPQSKSTVSLNPGRHPSHDPFDLEHLVPQAHHTLHYSEEGLNPLVDGSRHAQMQAKFQHPTVILDHSDHITGIDCTDPHSIDVCFEDREARDTAERSWMQQAQSGPFNLGTYHEGCGDLTGQKRSYFRVSHGVVNNGPECLRMAVSRIDESEALEEGEVSWGTYRDPGKPDLAVPLFGNQEEFPCQDEYDDDELVDIDTNVQAATHFFHAKIDPSKGGGGQIPYISPNGTAVANTTTRRRRWEQSMQSRQQHSMGKRFAPGGAAFMSGNVYQGLSDKTKDAQKGNHGGLIGQIAKFAVDVVTPIYEAFTSGVDRRYHYDYNNLNKSLKAGVSNKGPLVLGDTGYLVYNKPKPKVEGQGPKKHDYGISISCIDCGLDGSFTIDGHFAFHVRDGITKGNIILNVLSDIHFRTVLGLTVEGSYSPLKWKEQIVGIPITPFTVPGIFTLGPEITYSAKLDLKLEGKVEFIFGGTTTLSKGKAILDLKSEQGCKIEDGLVPSFQPRAELKGSLEATLSAGVPIGIEIGVDILDGKFKATVGLIDTPAVYVSAIKSFGKGSPCGLGGIEIRGGVKNKIEASAKIKPIGEWSLELHKLTIYDHGFGCYTNDGEWDGSAVLPDKGVFLEVGNSLDGNLEVDTATEARDLSEYASSIEPPSYYAIIMDKNETATLVTGLDGYIYLAKTGDHVGVAQTWGMTKPGSGVYAFDALDQVMGFDYDQYDEKLDQFLAVPRMVDTHEVPESYLSAGIARLDVTDKNSPLGLAMEDLNFMYPTFCKIKNSGLRLYGTKYVVGEDGKMYDHNDEEVITPVPFFTLLGLDPKDCLTISLVSSGVALPQQQQEEEEEEEGEIE